MSVSYDQALLLDVKDRNMSPDLALYIGDIGEKNPKEFKEKYLGRTPKGGYYTTLGEIEGLSRASKIGITRAINVGPGFGHISNQLNIAYKGMQFVTCKWEPSNQTKTFFVYICKDQDMSFITHIKKCKMSYSIIDRILTNHGFLSVKGIVLETDAKIVHIYTGNKMIVSLLTDEAYYNSIRIFSINDDKWSYTGKTTLLFDKNNHIGIYDYTTDKIQPKYLLQMDLSPVPIEAWDFTSWWDKASNPSILDDRKSVWEELLLFIK